MTPLTIILGMLIAPPAPTPLPDPVPLRRVLLDTDALPPAGGPWITLPRTVFEAKVQAAANAVAKPAPRLIEARMTARFADGQLNGDGVWTIHSTGTMALDPLSMAIDQMKWNDGIAAIAHREHAAATKLIVNSAKPLHLNWSLRGREEPQAFRFDYSIPPTPLATLDLDIPTDRTVTAGDALVTGPAVSPLAGHSRWRIACGGKSRIEIVIRSAESRRIPVIRGQRTVRYDIAADSVLSVFEFDLESLRGPADAWTFQIDAGVRILDVMTPNRDVWRVVTATDSKPSLLIVSLREPALTGRVSISAEIAPPNSGAAWTSPGVTVPGFAAEATLEFRFAPDVKLESWEAGDFVLLRTTPLADRGTAMTFRDSWRQDAAKPERTLPTLRMRTGSAETTSRDTLRWTLDAKRNHLSAVLRTAVTRGPIVQYPIKLPAGFTPVSIRTTPDDPAATWTFSGGTTWMLEPSRPWSTGSVIEIRLELRGPSVAPGTVVIPRIVAPLATTRNGEMFISLGETFSGTLTTPTGSSTGRTFTQPLAVREDESTFRIAAVPLLPTVAANGIHNTDFVKTNGATFAIHHRVDDSGDIVSTLTGVAHGKLQFVLLAGSTLETVCVAGKWSPFTIANELCTVSLPAGDNVPVEIRIRWTNSIVGWAALSDPKPAFYASVHVTAATWTASGRYCFWPTMSKHWESGPNPVVVDVRLIWAALSALVAFGLVLFLKSWPRSNRIAWVMLFLVTLASGAAALLLNREWYVYLRWPLTMMTVLLLFSLFIRRLKRTVPAIIVLFMLPLCLHSADEPATVYLRQSPNGMTVFVSQSLLDQLSDLAQGTEPGAVITAAEIRGQDDGDRLKFDGTFIANVLREGEQTLVLPLKDIPLEAVLIDGKAVLPVTVNDRPCVRVNGVGSHTLALRWQVPVAVIGTDRQAAFAFEDVPAASLALTMAATARQVDVMTRRGSQTIARGTDGVTLKADLGAVDRIAIRWRSGNAAQPVRITATELTLWDLATPENAVMAAFDFDVKDGIVTRLNFAIPAGLEASRISIRDRAGNAVGIRDWRVTPGSAVVLLQEPFEGAGIITLRLLPAMALTTAPTMAPVRLLSATSVNEAFLAVRTGSTVVNRWDRGTCVETSVESIPREFAALPELLLERNPPAKVYRVDANATVKAVIASSVIPQPQHDEISWRLGTKATASGKLHWGKEPLSVVEFDVPAAITLTEVAATELAGWSRTGSRVKLWLRSPQKDLIVNWYGSWSAYNAKLATVELPGSAKPQRILRVRAADDLRISIPPQKGWQPGVTLKPGEFVVIGTAAGPSLKVNLTRP